MTNWSRYSPHPRYRLYTNRSSYAPGGSRQPDNIEQLESEICRWLGTTGGVCVPMARTGLLLTLSEIIKPGQDVVMSPLTIVDVVNAVLLAGGRPVFADICRHTCGLDPEKAEPLIHNRTGAVLLTHLHGCSAGAQTFAKICSGRGVPLIEDAAQAFGATEGGRALGGIGDIGIYSFGFFKNLSTWRGGMVVSNDHGFLDRLRSRVRRLPELPRRSLLALKLNGLAIDLASWPPIFSNLVFPLVRCDFAAVNRRLDPEASSTSLPEAPGHWLLRMRESQARIGLCNLGQVNDDNRSRCDAARQYEEALRGYSEIILPRCAGDGTNIYTYFPIQFRQREKLLRFARQHGRDIAPQYLHNCADLPAFADFYRDCPEARAASKELILLPTYPRYPEIEIQRNIEVTEEFLRQRPS